MPDDPQPITPGTQGTIRAYDDAGHIMLNWDNGRGLHLIPGVDWYHIISSDVEIEQSFRVLHDQQQKVGRDEEAACPRCGREFDLHRGAVSRRIRAVNISICDQCGMQEAIEDFVANSSESGAAVSVTVPKGLNLTGYPIRPRSEDDTAEDGAVGLDVKVKRLEDWYIVRIWQGRGNPDDTDTAADDHSEEVEG